MGSVPTQADEASLIPCVHELFEHAASKYPNNPALISGNTTLTYSELNTFANQFAQVLIDRGITYGDIVGVALDRSVDLVAAMLAVMKIGAAYVPIDPALPAERVNQMLNDASPKLLLITNSTTSSTTTIPAETLTATLETLTLDQALHSIITHPSPLSDSNRCPIPPSTLAYVMYTSGSTGRPKGVEVTHANITNLLLAMRASPGCVSTDRLLAITTASFDMAVVELFLPLVSGAAVVLAQRHESRDPSALVQLVHRHGVTVMQGTPAVWGMVLDSIAAAAASGGGLKLGKIFCGGEAMSRALAERLMGCADEVWNMYGPTEATVYAAMWRVNRGEEVVVGGAIEGVRLYVVDPETLEEVEGLGREGELCIGGSGVARGYKGMGELSRQKFPENRFHGGKMYRTGDLARWVDKGKTTVSVSGRMDGQVKIRGYRVELGEIEAVIAEREDVSGAVAVCRDEQVVAYCVMAREARDKTKALGRLLRPWLAERLPDYMVPAFFVEMDVFPVTANGKVDRKALPDPLAALRQTRAVITTMTPDMELESQILKIWTRVLGHDQFDAKDNFFDVGGDSVRLVRVQRELEGLLDHTVSVPKLFEHYTVRTLAAYLTRFADITAPKRANDHHDVNTISQDEDIAITSMACRLPGDITTTSDFWALLSCGGDAITDVPPDRWNATDKSSYPRRGGFLSAPITSFDTSFFGISPREAHRLDPAQYMMLETCHEAFERAGYTTDRLHGSQTGVFIGTSNILSHTSLNPNAITRDNLTDLDGYTVTGTAGGTMSGRVSYHFGLQGPAMTIDTACSSSLVTTHLACSSLRQGECDMAVSGGVSLLQNLGLHVEFSRLGGMSPDGRCRSFSADAQGTGWSEGCAVVVLKRMSDALRDGDAIHAVIRGTAVNHDGRSASLTTPSGVAQERLIRTALAAARLRPEDIDYVEAHGTGTKLGDPIEAAALGEVFGPTPGEKSRAHPLLVGSVKSNIGHTQAAAGLVGLLKVTLALQHGVLPQSLNVARPTDAVGWDAANMMPISSQRLWPAKQHRLRTAGVSAFGIGGTNAHVIVQEPPPRKDNEKNNKATAASQLLHATPMPFVLSADTDAALRNQATNLHRHITANPQDTLQDIAYSLATTRNHLRKRLVFVAHSKPELLEKLAAPYPPAPNPSSPAPAAKLTLLFPGQGTQHPNMGKSLCHLSPMFSSIIHSIASAFSPYLSVPLLEAMWPTTTAAAAHNLLLNRTEYAQPALFALQVSLYRLWESWGIFATSTSTPGSVLLLGHSLGELAAAHVAGIFDLDDACRLVAARGRLMQAHGGGNYAMVSLEAGGDEVAAALEALGVRDAVDVAAYNTPRQTVVSGTVDGVEAARGYFAARGRRAKTVVVGHAFHSRWMEGAVDEFRAVAETVRYQKARVRIVSTVEGRAARDGEMECAEYWVRQVREPVRFGDAIQGAVRDSGGNVFLELGLDRTLCGMGAECVAGMELDAAWLPSLTRSGGDSVVVLQSSLTELHLRHVSVDWEAYFDPFGCRRVQLPTYAFQRTYEQKHTSSASVGAPPKVDYQFGIEWYPTKTDDTGPRLHGTWGVMIPTGRATISLWAVRVTTALSRAGLNIVQVEHLDQARTLDGLICLWDSDDADNKISGTQDSIEKALKQVQTAVQIQYRSPLVWITHHAVGTGDPANDSAIRLGPGPLLWGLMRTARNEHFELMLRLVDVGREEADIDCISSALISVLNTEPECVVRQGRVLVPRMGPIKAGRNPLPSAKHHRLMRSDGAVLITGGLGHLGGYAARWLASNHSIRDLVLVSRHGMSDPRAEALVDELSQLGARVAILASDISDPDSVSSIMATFTPGRPLRGVIHAAGVVDSGILSSMTSKRCDTAIAPKAYGAWLLHQATRDLDLDLFVMFSSISGVLGMPGLANYAAANTFLDALAHMRHAQGLSGTSVAYGTVAGDGGMEARLGNSARSHLANFGLSPLTTEQGMELLQQAVISQRPLTVAAKLDLQTLRGFYEEQGGGTIPPLLGSLFVPDSTDTGNGITKGKVPFSNRRDENLLQMLSETEPEQHANIVLHMVRQVVAKALGFTHPLGVDVDRPLRDIGIDSLTVVQMRNHLTRLTCLTLSVNIALLHPNLRALSAALLTQLREQGKDNNLSRREPSIPGTPTINTTALLKGCLDPSITFPKPPGPPPPLARPFSVLLTGATGFVGVFILHELLTHNIPTHCIVRASSPTSALSRLVATLQSYSLWSPSFLRLIHPLPGDISLPLLGLSPSTYAYLSTTVSTIVHSAALVDWLRPLSSYIGPNLVSTHELLRLAAASIPNKAFHLVSTISTLPLHTGLDLVEGSDAEYGYGTSKYLAERLVAAARWRGARGMTVYRLPYVTASTATGCFRRDKGDFLHNLVVGSLEMGACFPDVEAGDLAGVLPVDYLARTIVEIVVDGDGYGGRSGRDWDFVNPEPLGCGEFFGMLGAKEVVPFGEWKARVLEFAERAPGSALARIAAVVDGYTNETATAMLKGPALVGENVFGADGCCPAPVINEAFVRRYLERINRG